MASRFAAFHHNLHDAQTVFESWLSTIRLMPGVTCAAVPLHLCAPYFVCVNLHATHGFEAFLANASL